MNNIKETIGNNIRMLRKQRGQTLDSLSKQIGITHQQLSRVEKGGGTSTVTLERIATVLQVSTSDLLQEPNTTPNKNIQQTKNYIPESVCQTIYSQLLSNIVKPINDIAIDKHWDDIIENVTQNPKWIQQFIDTNTKKNAEKMYQFTSSELLKFCQELCIEFTSKAMECSKIDLAEEDEN